MRYLAIYGNGNSSNDNNFITELDMLDVHGNQINYTPSVVDGTCGSDGVAALDDDDTSGSPVCEFGVNRSRLVLDLGRSVKGIYSVRLTMFNGDTRVNNDVSLYGDVITSRFATASKSGC